MTTIFKTLAGSRLYGTSNENSDTDYKAVHLPTKEQILIRPKRDMVRSFSTGRPDGRNSSQDVDTESFELQYFLKLAADMQTIPVEMLFLPDESHDQHPLSFQQTEIWREIVKNRYKILNNNTKSFVGYCKGQAVRYSMRGDRLATYEAVCDLLAEQVGQMAIGYVMQSLADIDGVNVVTKRHGNRELEYLDVFGRQAPATISCAEALDIYEKPVKEAGKRAQTARDAGGADWKALYHAVRIVEQGISLFQHGIIRFPASNREFLMKIRSGEVEMDQILDVFEEKLTVLTRIGQNSPLAADPDKEWIDGFVAEQYERIVRGG